MSRIINQSINQRLIDRLAKSLETFCGVRLDFNSHEILEGHQLSELEDNFSFDLRFNIDFELMKSEIDWEPAEIKELYTINENSYALESLHCFLIVLGDLHRFLVEFNFTGNAEITKNSASKLYIV